MSTENDKEVLNSIFNPLLPFTQFVYEENIPEDFKDDVEPSIQQEESTRLEVAGIQAAEKGNMDQAIEILSQAILLSPSNPSPYNNRAQVLRMQGEIEKAVMDLNNAINLSGGKGKAACQAYCQRGLVHLKQLNQSEAKKDFESASVLGSAFAKAQLVQMNPYAAMCNKMLKAMITKCQTGESDYYDCVNEKNQI